MEELSERRLVENEMLFRSTNREVQRRVKKDRAKRHGPDGTKLHFYCECSRIYCRDRIKMTVDEYEDATENEKQFIILPGHENTRVEKVVRSDDGYSVVEKNIDPVRATAHTLE
jgi:hypothetical protein